MVKLKFKKIHKDAIIPSYKKHGDAGFDFHAVIEDSTVFNDNGLVAKRAVVIQPNSQHIIETGLSAEIEIGYEIQVRPRSGLAANNKITVTNSPGTIDCGYRGPIKVILFNLGSEPFIVKHGDRIAQGVVAVVPEVIIEEVDVLSETERGTNGIGSTGIR